MGKRHSQHDSKLEAALDELDAALTPDAIREILQLLPETDQAVANDAELLPPANQSGRVERKP